MAMATSEVFRVGFLGAGRMATALAGGWMTAGLVPKERIFASDPVPQARASFQKDTGVLATASNLAVAEKSDLLVLAVKPQNIADLCTEICPALTERHLVVSI